MSHYRLAAHLGTAFVIYAIGVWNGLSLIASRPEPKVFFFPFNKSRVVFFDEMSRHWSCCSPLPLASSRPCPKGRLRLCLRRPSAVRSSQVSMLALSTMSSLSWVAASFRPILASSIPGTATLPRIPSRSSLTTAMLYDQDAK